MQITTNQIYIMGDFNINLFHAKTSCYSQDFLHSLQTFHLSQLLTTQHVFAITQPP